MTEIKAYQTKDKRVFLSSEEANEHEYVLDLPLDIQSLYITKPLSKRELQVIDLLIKTPLSAIEMAEKLGISPRTIKEHCKRVYKKTNTKCRIELVVGYYQSLTAS